MAYTITKRRRNKGLAFDLYFRWKGQRYRPLLGYNLSPDQGEQCVIELIHKIQTQQVEKPRSLLLLSAGGRQLDGVNDAEHTTHENLAGSLSRDPRDDRPQFSTRPAIGPNMVNFSAGPSMKAEPTDRLYLSSTRTLVPSPELREENSMSASDRAYMRRPDTPPSPRLIIQPPPRPTNPFFVLGGLAIILALLQGHPFETFMVSVFGPSTRQEVSTLALRSTPPPISPPLSSRYAPYLTAITPVSTDLRALAYEKIRTCPPGDKTCAIAQLYRYVQRDLGYLSDPLNRDFIQTPSETLRIGAGDCEDLSILLTSLLENVGVPTYLVFTNNHAYALACEVDESRLRPTIEQVYQEASRTQVSEQTVTLDPQGILAWTLDGPQNHTVSYAISASDPIDLMVLPTPEDADALRRNSTYQQYYACSQEQITHLDTECRVSPTARLLARNRSDRTVTASISLRIQVPPPPLRIPSSLHTYRMDGTTCVTLDPAIKGDAYPGQVMDSVKTAPERIAVNLSGQGHRL